MDCKEALNFLDEHCTASVIPLEVKIACSNALAKQIELSDFIKRLDPIEEYPLIVILRKYVVDC